MKAKKIPNWYHNKFDFFEGRYVFEKNCEMRNESCHYCIQSWQCLKINKLDTLFNVTGINVDSKPPDKTAAIGILTLNL